MVDPLPASSSSLMAYSARVSLGRRGRPARRPARSTLRATRAAHVAGRVRRRRTSTTTRPVPIATAATGTHGTRRSAAATSFNAVAPGLGFASGTAAVGSKFCHPYPGNHTWTQAWASSAWTCQRSVIGS